MDIFIKLNELNSQLDILIKNAENDKLKYLNSWQKSLFYITDGNLQAFKLIKTLVNTNLKNN